MAKWGFRRGRYNPCLYWRADDDLMAMVHGDDFVSVGSREAAKRFREQLESRFEIKTQVMGPGNSVSSARALTEKRETILQDPDQLAALRACMKAVEEKDPEDVTE